MYNVIEENVPGYLFSVPSVRDVRPATPDARASCPWHEHQYWDTIHSPGCSQILDKSPLQNKVCTVQSFKKTTFVTYPKITFQQRSHLILMVLFYEFYLLYFLLSLALVLFSGSLKLYTIVILSSQVQPVKILAIISL